MDNNFAGTVVNNYLPTVNPDAFIAKLRQRIIRTETKNDLK